MAKLIVNYKAVRPDYNDFKEVFIAEDIDECWNQKFSLEDWICFKNEISCLTNIFKDEIIKEEV